MFRSNCAQTWSSLKSVTANYVKVWKITRQKILFSRFLCGGDWAKADITLGTLSALQSELDICLLRAELSFRLGDMDATRNLVAKIISESEQVGLIM